MIEFLEGDVRRVGNGSILLMTRFGVGYLVHTPEKFDVGDPVQLWIHQRFREAETTLFGFKSLAAMNLCVDLMRIQGVGPKGAQAMLKGGVDLLTKALREQDLDFFTSKPGIGKKTAAKVLAELKIR